ncbi:MAG: hypothetical protein HQ582_18440, partial [Planctomycetes bacterium]|nr:hypothetical protein [Planctomycetota bacterium]
DKTEMQRQPSLRDARALVEPYFQQARQRGDLHYPHRDFVHFYDYPRPGVLHFNMTRINRVNGLSSQDLTHAEIEGRRQAALLAEWLVKESPYFRHAWLVEIPGVEKLLVRVDRNLGYNLPGQLADLRWLLRHGDRTKCQG